MVIGATGLVAIGAIVAGSFLLTDFREDAKTVSATGKYPGGRTEDPVGPKAPTAIARALRIVIYFSPALKNKAHFLC